MVNAYRAELLGILIRVVAINLLCKCWGVMQETVDLHIDCLGVIHKLQCSGCWIPQMWKHADLIRETKHELRQVVVEVHLQHVKAYQDDLYS